MIRRLLIILTLLAAALGALTGTAIGASADGRHPSTPARRAPLPVLYNLGGSDSAAWNLAQRRPVIFYLAADGSASLGDKAHHLKWKTWKRSSATATGRYYYRTGQCCKYRSDAVKITAYHVVRQSARKSWYDRMRIRFSKHDSVTIRFERLDGFGFWAKVAGRFP